MSDKYIRDAADMANDDLATWYSDEDLFDIACDFAIDCGEDFASAYYSEICAAYPEHPL